MVSSFTFDLAGGSLCVLVLVSHYGNSATGHDNDIIVHGSNGPGSSCCCWLVPEGNGIDGEVIL